MKILGIGGSAHDYSYCLLNDGNIEFAIEEERLSREKHAIGKRSWRMGGIDYVLSQCGYNMKSIDFIATNTICKMDSLLQKPYIHNIIKVNHHMAHIAASYYTSNFSESALAVLDGCGDIYEQKTGKVGEIHSIGYAQGRDLYLSKSFYGKVERIDANAPIPCFVKSLGHFYMYMTYVCGFQYCQEGKTMGLAPYGCDRFVERICQHIDYSKYDFMNSTIVDEIKLILQETKQEPTFQVKADLACMAQIILQKYTFMLLNDLYAEYPSKNLCLSGGVVLNSAMNGLIKQHTPFDNVYIYPAAGDAGTAVGAALYVYHQTEKEKKQHVLSVPSAVFSGTSYTQAQIENDLVKFKDKIKWSVLEEDQLIAETANRIAKGEICGWFQGRSEMGPRALGNRSILADPRDGSMKERINSTVKFREDFRPFAPSVIQEAVDEYFDTDFCENPFMLYVGKVKKEKCSSIPSVTHVDQSARFQTVNEKFNPRYYKLIRYFGSLTGIPILLNTSFNTRSQPIVEKPSTAIDAFLNSQISFLAIENYLVEKITPPMNHR